MKVFVGFTSSSGQHDIYIGSSKEAVLEQMNETEESLNEGYSAHTGDEIFIGQLDLTTARSKIQEVGYISFGQ